MSNPVIATTPPKAMPRPTRTCQRCRTPRNSWNTAIQPDCRQTRAVAAATEVSCREVMKQAKCRARATAAARDQRNSVPVTRRELARLPDQHGSGHHGRSDRIAPEGDGQGADGRGAQGGGDEGPGRGHAQHSEGGKEEVHGPTVVGPGGVAADGACVLDRRRWRCHVLNPVSPIHKGDHNGVNHPQKPGQAGGNPTRQRRDGPG